MEYKIAIKQYKYDGTYWFQIIVNGDSIVEVINTVPKNFTSVTYYASDPWNEPFSSELGYFCQVKVLGM